MTQELNIQNEIKEISKNDRSFIDPVNFYESERNSGYKNTGTALFELIDNSYEADATKIFVVAKNKSKTNQPESLAIIDNGAGMNDGFIVNACKIGGTDRASANTPLRRRGYGRFGHGLPKSSLSQTRSFSVYSKNKDNKKWRVVNVDIDKLLENKANPFTLPEEQEVDIFPEYIQECLDKNFKEDSTGTIIAWNTCDRMTWKTDESIVKNLGWRVAMSYWRNIKAGLKISLLGTFINPIDPLFLDESCNHVKSCGPFTIKSNDGSEKKVTNTIQAETYPTWQWPFKVKSEGKEETIYADVRLSYFPSGFGAKDSSQKTLGRNQSIRQKILTEFNGILFYRQGRFIDCLRHIPNDAIKKRTFQTYDQNYKIEINFPASLDEQFGIATNKQYVNLPYSTINHEMWKRLMTDCAGLYERAMGASKEAASNALASSDAAINALDAADKILERGVLNPVDEKKQKMIEEIASKNLDKVIDLEVERRKQISNQPQDKEKIKAEIIPQYSDPKRIYNFEDTSEFNPFFRVKPIGSVREFYINKNHNFYKKIWLNPRCSDFMKETLKLIMSAIGESSLGATDDARRWYSKELAEWSNLLHLSTDLFSEKNNLDTEPDINQDNNLDDDLPN